MDQTPVDRYFVARTQPRRERWAVENIDNMGRGVIAHLFYPQVLERKYEGARRCRTLVLRPAPLFPGIVFVKTVAGQWRFMLGAYGVSSIFMQGEQPAFVPQREIDKIMAKMDDSGFVVLDDKVVAVERFTKNQSVRINEGVYSGYCGLYQGQTGRERLQLLIDYMGRRTKVLVPDSACEAA